MAGELHEKCAVVGVVGEGAAEAAFAELYALQHRGVEGSGIASMTAKGQVLDRREPGFVRDVHTPRTLARLKGNIAIGHNRYSTNGSKEDNAHAQPVRDKRIGFAMATNGNLPVLTGLRRHLEQNRYRTRHLNDSEMQAHAIALGIRGGSDLPEAVEESSHLFHGSFSTVAMHDGLMVAFRDPYGIRPLELGVTEDGYTVASETCGLEAIGAEHVRTVEPGEMLIITQDGYESRQLAEGQHKLDIFELVYFASPDSYLYDQSITMTRIKLGQQLAEQYPGLGDLKDALVIPVPDTSIPAAEGFAKALGQEFTASSVVKHRYVGRTFMLKNQRLRQHFLAVKHRLISELVKDRIVIFVDDSIVRLNTGPQLVKKAYAAGAKAVYFLSASPPVRFPDFYGIDTPKQQELPASYLTVEQMRQAIGCKMLGFLELGRMVEATGKPHSMFNLAAFNGEYPIDIGHNKRKIHVPVETSFLD